MILLPNKASLKLQSESTILTAFIFTSYSNTQVHPTSITFAQVLEIKLVDSLYLEKFASFPISTKPKSMNADQLVFASSLVQIVIWFTSVIQVGSTIRPKEDVPENFYVRQKLPRSKRVTMTNRK
ncbi:hypothetical protein PHYBLDRAFT_174457 [Phycomyces blakesleeanus NRRL 1555(-)]|uniref:Uncharacterized protein n=1 Tax=Phycomyces blakesleeanus (strain ATCC 8743b / DSM 1359 / FGSC 10004 / NBRC 33097 / NRRL 1555) TaxID=763407 RepID=A0A162T9Q7_PHYB8|nr:hypothetical protein PHYBLDRAFT_174457 [Phycomyces blakesleeanus NRRL 1555(-)]OAD67072.1 hypothetical protein PHYBLDRAFT_174457 [Phycomyces blakesleeanus NRRL 1555(-)]|eukprot:XP_018285112.1 hypothetical protein PHYBLDRAFT_174457 [Phycomyces blakesleeanus NRRL 1555(-)]